jgi:hypothetical protein
MSDQRNNRNAVNRFTSPPSLTLPLEGEGRVEDKVSEYRGIRADVSRDRRIHHGGDQKIALDRG